MLILGLGHFAAYGIFRSAEPFLHAERSNCRLIIANVASGTNGPLQKHPCLLITTESNRHNLIGHRVRQVFFASSSPRALERWYDEREQRD